MLANNVENFKEYMVDHINNFLRSKKKKSEMTAKTYENQLINFFKDVYGYDSFNFITKQDIENLTLPTLRNYFDRMYEEVKGDKRVYSNATINLRMTSIKQLLKYLHAWDVIDNYPIFKLDELLKSLPNESTRIKTIPFEVAQKFFYYFKNEDKSETNIEKYLFCKIACDTALRSTEILSLSWDNFTVEKDCVVMEATPESLGKGGEYWIDKISLEFFEEIKQLKKDESNKLFTISYRTMSHAMTVANQKLGFKKNEFTAHSFKKAAVTSTYRYTNDFMSAVKKGRHKNPQTTMRYIETMDYGLTGTISTGDGVDKELYKKLTHEELLKVIEGMDNTTKYLINSKANELTNKRNK